MMAAAGAARTLVGVLRSTLCVQVCEPWGDAAFRGDGCSDERDRALAQDPGARQRRPRIATRWCGLHPDSNLKQNWFPLSSSPSPTSLSRGRARDHVIGLAPIAGRLRRLLPRPAPGRHGAGAQRGPRHALRQLGGTPAWCRHCGPGPCRRYTKQSMLEVLPTTRCRSAGGSRRCCSGAPR
jgi:hypothetical protein